MPTYWQFIQISERFLGNEDPGKQLEKEMALASSPDHFPKGSSRDELPLHQLGNSVLSSYRGKGETCQVGYEDVPAPPLEGGRKTNFCVS